MSYREFIHKLLKIKSENRSEKWEVKKWKKTFELFLCKLRPWKLFLSLKSPWILFVWRCTNHVLIKVTLKISLIVGLCWLLEEISFLTCQGLGSDVLGVWFWSIYWLITVEWQCPIVLQKKVQGDIKHVEGYWRG